MNGVKYLQNLLSGVLLISSLTSFGQSKKELIDIYSNRFDSLTNVISSQNEIIQSLKDSCKKHVILFKNHEQILNNEISKLTKQKDSLQSTIQNLVIEIDAERKKNLHYDPSNVIFSSSIKDQLTIYDVFESWNLEVILDEEAVKRDLLSTGHSIQGDEEITVKFFLIDHYLVVSYNYNEAIGFDTKIIDINSKKEVLLQSKVKFYVTRLDVSLKNLIVSTEGYDNLGHFWQSGLLNLEKLQLIFNQKEY